MKIKILLALCMATVVGTSSAECLEQRAQNATIIRLLTIQLVALMNAESAIELEKNEHCERSKNESLPDHRRLAGSYFCASYAATLNLATHQKNTLSVELERFRARAVCDE